MIAVPPLDVLAQAFPMDDAVRIELREGVPTFRATPKIQERVEELLEKQPAAALTADEERELAQYEELDGLLSLVNRLVRNLVQSPGGTAIRAGAA
jgi:hypothetical protein